MEALSEEVHPFGGMRLEKKRRLKMTILHDLKKSFVHYYLAQY